MNFKRNVTILILLLTLLSLVGCDGIPFLSTESRAPEAQPTAIPASKTLVTTPASIGELQVHFIDVGQGDAILVDLGPIEVLIDGGDRSPGIVEYLRPLVDGQIEVMVATHPHADHIGGLIEVLETFDVATIWLNGDSATSKTYADFMNVVNAEGAQIMQARLGQVIQTGDLEFQVLHPTQIHYDNTNDNSIVLSLSWGDIDFLFTGDAEAEAERAMLVQSQVQIPNVEIMKVGHHGSHTASSIDFLSITQPDVAIYMAGEDNRYGHPHAETIAALESVNARIFGTENYGTIVVTTNGRDYSLAFSKD